MFKKTFRRYRKYRYDHRFDYPVMFFSIELLLLMLKICGVAVLTYGLYLAVLKIT